jgi:excisionase family DNA binding protein
VPIADKLLLTIAEAQALTGLSREFLRDAINKGSLKAKVIGKGWRVKRSDLQEYVDKGVTVPKRENRTLRVKALSSKYLSPSLFYSTREQLFTLNWGESLATFTPISGMGS